MGSRSRYPGFACVVCRRGRNAIGRVLLVTVLVCGSLSNSERSESASRATRGSAGISAISSTTGQLPRAVRTTRSITEINDDSGGDVEAVKAVVNACTSAVGLSLSNDPTIAGSGEPPRSMTRSPSFGSRESRQRARTGSSSMWFRELRARSRPRAISQVAVSKV
jgi:hypothetical protein